MNKIRFDELMISNEVQKAINDLGFDEATPIQAEAIPVLLNGKDIIGQAQTGTGKTAAFGIPAIEMIDSSVKHLQALIMCPTRELAIQVTEEMSKIAKYKKDISFLAIYGGQPIDRQIRGLKKGVQIIIGTPGRMIDHLDRKTINLSNIKFVVLDEADEMLDMGFRDDIEIILKNTPRERQTVLFSATMRKEISDLAKKYQNNPISIKVVHEVLTVPNTEQFYFELRERDKLETLSRIVDLYNIKLALVFCNTKRGVDELVEHLKIRGYSADGLHGDMRQVIREKVINKFKKGNLEILVATDVAARGLDIENVEAVFNYDLPQDEYYYVHRIGRTGRAGKPGKAFSFVTGREIFKLRVIQKFIKTKIKPQIVPTYQDVEEMRTNLYIDEIKKVINQGELKKYIHFVERLINEDYTSLDVAAALIKLNLEENKGTNGFDEEDNKKSGRQRAQNLNDSQQVRLFLNVGKKDKVRPGDILGAITGESAVPGKEIGTIDMYEAYTFVNVPSEYADEIIECMNGARIKSKKISVELANKKKKK